MENRIILIAFMVTFTLADINVTLSDEDKQEMRDYQDLNCSDEFGHEDGCFCT